MAQTDRQTDNSPIDKQAKSTWWILTAFPQDQIDKLKDASTYPEWVSKVHGGCERCPETDKIHFQGAIQARRQVRWSAVHQWLSNSWFRPAKSSEAARKYAMKDDTAIEGKEVRENEMPHYPLEAILRLLGEAHRNIEDLDCFIVNNKFDSNAHYYHLLDTIVEERGDAYIRLFANPIVKTLFQNMAVWKRKPDLTITGQADGEDNEIISPATV